MKEQTKRLVNNQKSAKQIKCHNFGSRVIVERKIVGCWVENDASMPSYAKRKFEQNVVYVRLLLPL